jgi:peptidoglycan/xylan/chitin deacetylase (PgdA/CDA1 family)
MPPGIGDGRESSLDLYFRGGRNVAADFQLSRIERVRLLTKRIAAFIFFYSGINSLYGLLIKRRLAVVLMYHRVVDVKEGNGGGLQPGMYVTLNVFEGQMRYLARRYKVVDLEAFIPLLRARSRFPRNTCLLTFDDGWEDTYRHAFPVLRKYHLPAVVFLVSDYVNTEKVFWTEKAFNLLAKYLQEEEPERGNLEKDRLSFRKEAFRPLDNPSLTPVQKMEMILEALKRLDPTDREKTIHELEAWVEGRRIPESPQAVVLNWEQVLEMGQGNITFGAHTKTHAILPRLSPAEAKEEIVESKKSIERQLSKECGAFCYPNGDYDQDIRRVVSENYSCAFTTHSGFVTPSDDLYQLKRIGIHNDAASTLPLFACKLTGLLR